MMARLCRLILALAFVASPMANIAASAAQTTSLDDDIIPGVLYVQFVVEPPSGATPGKMGMPIFDRAAAKHGVYAMEKAFPIVEAVARRRAISKGTEALRRIYTVRFSGSFTSLQVAKALARDPNLVYAEPRYRYQLHWDSLPEEGASALMPEEPNDPMWTRQTHLSRIGMPDAWEIVKGEQSDVVIAIIDGGTDWDHPDLLANVWTNSDEIADNGVDDDDNGFIDDIHGWNFAADTSDPTGLPSTPNNARHGTATAGVAAAATNNGVGIAGTSWNARFMPINSGCTELESLCFTTAGIVYASMMGADVINASWGGDVHSPTQELAIRAALDEGALLVASSGNDGRNIDVEPSYPAALNLTLSVGGTGKNSDYYLFNYGRSVNLLAPARSINATYGGGYAEVSGTSFSAPLVAGIAALVKTAHPNFTPQQVRAQVRLTADNVDSANPSTVEGLLGRGRVNSYRAVTEAAAPSVRLTEWDFMDDDGNLEIVTGETVEITATFTNFHSDADGLVVELESDESFVRFITGSANIGALAHGESYTAQFSFVVGDDAPDNRTLVLFTRITSTSLIDTPDVLRLQINETSVATHASGALTVSLTNEGNLGFTDLPGGVGSRGVGFIAVDALGVARNALFEGGLLVATSASTVSDCVRGIISGMQETDFTLKQGASLEIIKPWTKTSEKGKVLLVDTGAANPLGVEILQESFVDSSAANEDFIILKYTLTNTTDEDLSNVHVGLFFDWDVNITEGATSDIAGFDDERMAGYVQDGVNPKLFAGVRMLSDDAQVHYRAIDLPQEIYAPPSGNGFTPREKWEFMSGGISVRSLHLKDVGQIMAAGPHDIPPSDAIEVVFAVIAGMSLDDFLQNADNAQALWDHVLTDDPTSIENPQVPEEWALNPAYPHPALPPATFTYEVGAVSDVRLEVYDVLGRQVRTLFAGQKFAGSHSSVWDGLDAAGMPVASGLYVARLTARGARETFVESRPLVILR